MIWSRKICQGLAYFDTGPPAQRATMQQMAQQTSAHASRPALVFIHGVGLRAESWYQQLDFFSPHYHCYALDMPGHGDSPCLDKIPLQLTDFAKAVIAFIDTLIEQPVILIGHSLGAMTVLQATLDYQQHSIIAASNTASDTDSNTTTNTAINTLSNEAPSTIHPKGSVSTANLSPKICAVVALNAIYNRPQQATQQVQQRATSLLNDLNKNVSDAPVERWFNNDSRYQVQAELCRNWLETGNRTGYANAYQMFANLQGISADKLQQIQVPTLFITGELDANSSAQMSLAMADIIPKADAVIIANARHMTQMTHADVVNSSLADFFAHGTSQCLTKT